MKQKKKKLSITIYETLEQELYNNIKKSNLSAGKYIDDHLTEILPEYTVKKVNFETSKHYTDMDNKIRFEQRISEENWELIDKIAKDNYMDKSATFQIIFANYFAKSENN